MTELPMTPIETYYQLLREAQHALMVVDHFDRIPGSDAIYARLQSDSTSAQQALVKFITANAEAVLAALTA